VAQKNNPQDREINDRFITTKDNLPADQLHRKRLQLLEPVLVNFPEARPRRDRRRWAKEQMYTKFEIAGSAMRYAIENPGMAAPELTGGVTTVATDPKPDDTGEYPVVPAAISEGDPWAGTGLGPFRGRSPPMSWWSTKPLGRASETNRWCNRVRKRRRRTVLAKHHRKVLRAIEASKAKGTTCPPHPKRPKDYLP
jgi:hypothetical protein